MIMSDSEQTGLTPSVTKAFIYLGRCDRAVPAILAMESPEEPGYETPRGKIEDGETIVEGALRELREESGHVPRTPLERLAVVRWRDEEQHFFVGLAEGGLPDRFDHVVTGEGGDNGMTCRYSWIDLDDRANMRLVQGSDRCLSELRRWIATNSQPDGTS